MLLFQSVGMDNLDPDTIFVGVLGFMWAEFLWEAYIGLFHTILYCFNMTFREEAKGCIQGEHQRPP